MWPNAAPQPPDRASASLRRQPGELDVLLVEDNPGDARLVWEALHSSTEARFRVHHVQSLGEALGYLGANRPDVVLLDLSLPDSTGMVTLARVQESAPHLPIVVMTGNSDPGFASQALEAGAQDYLVKSDDPTNVVARAIRYAITRMNGQVERQQLIERLEEEQALMRRELEIARAMQFDLLPKADRINRRLNDMRLSMQTCFVPSLGIGGDLMGCLDLGPDRMGVFAFDFSGHGIGAALNVFRLHTLIGDHPECHDDPAALLGVLNNALKGLLAVGQYATMVYCIFDIAAGELVWSGAAAPPPVVITADGQPEFLDTRGLPLGVARDTVYVNQRRLLPPGTSLFIYSDAIPEAVGSDGAMLGESGLLELLRQSWNQDDCQLDLLMQGLHARVPGPLDDDLTAIWIRRG